MSWFREMGWSDSSSNFNFEPEVMIEDIQELSYHNQEEVQLSNQILKFYKRVKTNGQNV